MPNNRWDRRSHLLMARTRPGSRVTRPDEDFAALTGKVAGQSKHDFNATSHLPMHWAWIWTGPGEGHCNTPRNRWERFSRLFANDDPQSMCGKANATARTSVRRRRRGCWPPARRMGGVAARRTTAEPTFPSTDGDKTARRDGHVRNAGFAARTGTLPGSMPLAPIWTGSRRGAVTPPEQQVDPTVPPVAKSEKSSKHGHLQDDAVAANSAKASGQSK